MILAIDIGGTKTLLAPIDENGKVVSEHKFPTPQNYKAFIVELEKTIVDLATDFELTVVAAPGKINVDEGVVVKFGNLPWKNVPLQKDISVVVNTTVIIDNDANLAGLGEAIHIKPLPKRVLYITFSTGIGSGIITNGVIDPEFSDSEAGSMLFEYEGRLLPWEKFASGRAIVAKYGKRASDLDDPKAWQEISKWFALGIVDLCAVLEPDIVIIGGSVGTYFNKYGKYLNKYAHEIAPKMVTIPPIIGAQKAEEAVIYGCIELARQHNEHN